uniref:G-protein coupled receptors family 1 profile domain-containing protein n=1 Tax=Timema bartmani TaxID=61472 RepID=A0A7R9EWS2_9NEOP|nr:unnamed protein product [Timema bartmani]
MRNDSLETGIESRGRLALRSIRLSRITFHWLSYGIKVSKVCHISSPLFHGPHPHSLLLVVLACSRLWIDRNPGPTDLPSPTSSPHPLSAITHSSPLGSERLRAMNESASVMNASLGPPAPDGAGRYSIPEMVLIAIVAGFLSLITVVGNSMVMISFKIDKQLQTISNYFLFSLAVADFAIGLISMPLFTVSTLLGYWPLGPHICDTWLALDYLASNASVLNLLIISFDRYFSVTRPLTYRAKRTTNRAAIMIGCAWGISLLLWPPWIYSWPYIEGQRTVPDAECYIQFIETNHYITFGTAIAAFYVPVSVMCILYWRIWRETEKRQKDLPNLQAGKKDSSKRSTSSQQEIHLQYERGPPPGNEYLSVFYSQQEIHLQHEDFTWWSGQTGVEGEASIIFQNPELSRPTAFMLLSVASYSLLNAELSLAAAVGHFSGVVYSSGAFRLQPSLDCLVESEGVSEGGMEWREGGSSYKQDLPPPLIPTSHLYLSHLLHSTRAVINLHVTTE